ncbi:helix-turn-helix transcriptional regulator [Breoghania sp.]|uniref:helix-turn-helix transcriptional regulator n=1 Tax=Breoghania sp. TaxID=2065378 RepID=UPI002AA93B9F|nr:helix-turn-helix transcriptional regulator [Breoghania sp.]
MLNSKQCRAARAWLGWSQDQLADASCVSKRAIAGFELGRTVPQDRTLRDLRNAFEAAGIEFLSEGAFGVGIRQRME